VPAAAVIPAPIAYIKVVAVKKLVVEYLAGAILGSLSRCSAWSSVRETSSIFTGRLVDRTLYFEKIRVFQAGNCLDTLAWNNGIGL
jgi:hypothetical protein